MSVEKVQSLNWAAVVGTTVFKDQGRYRWRLTIDKKVPRTDFYWGIVRPERADQICPSGDDGDYYMRH